MTRQASKKRDDANVQEDEAEIERYGNMAIRDFDNILSREPTHAKVRSNFE